MRMPRLRPPPLLTDCCRPDTKLELFIWRIRAWYIRNFRPYKVRSNKNLIVPIFSKDISGILTGGDDIRKILIEHSMKEQTKWDNTIT